MIPLFSFEIAFNQHGKLTLGKECNAIMTDVLATLDKILASFSDIPQIEPQIMTKLIWRPTPVLNVPQSDDTMISSIYDEIRTAFSMELSEIIL